MKTLKVLLLLAVVLSVDHSVTADPIPAEDNSVNKTIHKPEDSILGDTIGNGSSNHSVPEATADHSSAEDNSANKTEEYIFLGPNKARIVSLFEFQHVIKCEAEKDSIVPLAKYLDYGCYCGIGGSGTPVDDLDRCCQVHDECYGVVQKHPKCNSYFFLKSAAVPYFNTYDYTCDQETNKAKCSETNDECQMVLCECDRKAAECFAESPYNSWNHKLNQTLCE